MATIPSVISICRDQKRVRFHESPTVAFVDHDFTEEERDQMWFKPEYLRAQTDREINLYRRTWTSPVVSKSYCWRGLEHRLKNNDVQKRKWWTFLKSFIAFQRDIQQLPNADVANLLMVYASKQSQTDRTKARQVGLHDEAEAFKVYCEDDTEKRRRKSFCSLKFGASSNSSSAKKMSTKAGRARSF